jgi:hypothetical protein
MKTYSAHDQRRVRGGCNGYVASMINVPVGNAQFCDVPRQGANLCPHPCVLMTWAPAGRDGAPRLPPENPREALTIGDKR